MPKQRVESCFTIGPPLGSLSETKGTWRWPNGWVVDYSISTVRSELDLFFKHTGVGLRQEIPLQHTEPNYGGVRWWFLCPKCRLRVSRLYKPQDLYCFFCRHCHGLSYESSLLSGSKQWNAFKAFGKDIGMTTREATRYIRLEYAPKDYTRSNDRSSTRCATADLVSRYS